MYKLIFPNESYLNSYIDAFNKLDSNDFKKYRILDPTKIDVLNYFKDSKKGINLPTNYVAATYLWLVDGKNFIAEVSIRHQLTDSLMKYGGNIGYIVRKEYRRMGMGTILLRKALVYCKDVLKLKKVLITCNDTNIGSLKIIEKNNGKLENKIINIINDETILTRRYWIYLE